MAVPFFFGQTAFFLTGNPPFDLAALLAGIPKGASPLAAAGVSFDHTCAMASTRASTPKKSPAGAGLYGQSWCGVFTNRD